MDFDTYEKKKRVDYAGLAETVAAILGAAIRAQPSLRLQQVHHRAKDPESLRKKLIKNGQLGADNIGIIVKDLAGCRFVFYTNSDVSRFLSSGIVRDNFEIDWDKSRIHYPRSEDSKASEQFISNNYLVKLNFDRLALPEYSRFADIWCEVQVQTTLNHAWSEMAHDTIYKKPDLEGGFGGRLMQSIEDRMKRIMREYLLPAGYEFQKVLADFKCLSSGKELFDRGDLASLADCDDNSARHDILTRFATYVLPNYDDIAGVQGDVRTAIVRAVKEARTTPTRSIDTPFGDRPGRTVDDIVAVAAGIVEQLQYADVDATFDAICELYEGALGEKERERWIKSAEALAEHNLFVWQQVGPEVQYRLANRIRTMPADMADPVRPVLIAILRKVLDPEVSGTSGGFDKIILHRGAVVPSERLQSTRAIAIEALKAMFEAAATDTDRKTILQALAVATRQTAAAGRKDELTVLVLRDSLTVVRFYRGIAPALSYELRQHIEHDLLWLYRHSNSGAVADPDHDLVDEQTALRKAILEYRDLVNSDEGYVTYKTLVGFKSVFPPAWDDPNFKLERKDAYREQRIDQLVARVNANNAASWLDILRRYAATESDDLATFPSFRKFLEKLGTAQPEIVLGYLDQLDDRLANFLPSILAGLDGGRCHQAMQTRLRRWLDEGLYVDQIARHLQFAKSIDVAHLDRALQLAFRQDNLIAVLQLVAVAAVRHDDVEGGLVDRLFMPALAYLAARDDTRWVNVVWPRSRKNSLFADVSAEQTKVMLASLVRRRKIDFDSEEILSAIATRWPNEVIGFFGARMRLTGDDRPTDYSPVPFE